MKILFVVAAFIVSTTHVHKKIVMKSGTEPNLNATTFALLIKNEIITALP